MKISILTDNHAGGTFGAEHGLSFYIEYKGFRLLLDTGHSDLFLKNAQHMGIELHDHTDALVLSHGHWDHGNGLQFLSGIPLYTHPKSFMRRYRQKDRSYIGLDLTEAQIAERYPLHKTAQAIEISKEVWFLGEVPRNIDFETPPATFEDEQGMNDTVPDDSGVVVKLPDGLVIISGCAHAGICNTIEHAKQVTGCNVVKAVMGGFHLKLANERVDKTIAWLRAQNIAQVYPSHCTDLPALAKFQQAFNSSMIKTGQVWVF